MDQLSTRDPTIAAKKQNVTSSCVPRVNILRAPPMSIPATTSTLVPTLSPVPMATPTTSCTTRTQQKQHVAHNQLGLHLTECDLQSPRGSSCSSRAGLLLSPTAVPLLSSRFKFHVRHHIPYREAGEHNLDSMSSSTPHSWRNSTSSNLSIRLSSSSSGSSGSSGGSAHTSVQSSPIKPVCTSVSSHVVQVQHPSPVSSLVVHGAGHTYSLPSSPMVKRRSWRKRRTLYSVATATTGAAARGRKGGERRDVGDGQLPRCQQFDRRSSSHNSSRLSPSPSPRCHAYTTSTSSMLMFAPLQVPSDADFTAYMEWERRLHTLLAWQGLEGLLEKGAEQLGDQAACSSFGLSLLSPSRFSNPTSPSLPLTNSTYSTHSRTTAVTPTTKSFGASDHKHARQIIKTHLSSELLRLTELHQHRLDDKGTSATALLALIRRLCLPPRSVVWEKLATARLCFGDDDYERICYGGGRHDGNFDHGRALAIGGNDCDNAPVVTAARFNDVFRSHIWALHIASHGDDDTDNDDIDDGTVASLYLAAVRDALEPWRVHMLDFELELFTLSSSSLSASHPASTHSHFDTVLPGRCEVVREEALAAVPQTLQKPTRTATSATGVQRVLDLLDDPDMLVRWRRRTVSAEALLWKARGLGRLMQRRGGLIPCVNDVVIKEGK